MGGKSTGISSPGTGTGVSTPLGMAGSTTATGTGLFGPSPATNPTLAAGKPGVMPMQPPITSPMSTGTGFTMKPPITSPITTPMTSPGSLAIQPPITSGLFTPPPVDNIMKSFQPGVSSAPSAAPPAGRGMATRFFS